MATRKNRDPGEKKEAARQLMELIRGGLSLKDASLRLGIKSPTNARAWLDAYGGEFGWTGSAKNVAVIGPGPVAGAGEDAEWLAKNAGQLQLGMPPQEEDGDTLMSRPQPPASEMTGAIVRPPPERETRRMRRAPEEPLYRAEHVREEPPPTPAPSTPLIESDLLRQALREKDAVLTTLEILLREGRIKLPH